MGEGREGGGKEEGRDERRWSRKGGGVKGWRERKGGGGEAREGGRGGREGGGIRR